MGTPNFASPKNASKHFVVLTTREVEAKECPECGHFHKDWEYNSLEEVKNCDLCDEDISEVEVETQYESPDEFEYDDLISNLHYEIKAIGGYKNDYWFNGRNYERRAISSISRSKAFGDLDVEVVITALIQNAYYEGATLDFIIEVNGEGIESGYYTTSIEDALEETIYSSDMNEGLKKIQSQHAENWAETAISDLSEQIEGVFENFSEHKLKCMGVFSNGEAVYEKA